MGNDDEKVEVQTSQPVQLNYARPPAPSSLFCRNKHERPAVYTVILASFAATVICFYATGVNRSFERGEIFVFSMAPAGFVALLAFLVAILAPPETWRGRAYLALFCLLPALFIVAILFGQDVVFRII